MTTCAVSLISCVCFYINTLKFRYGRSRKGVVSYGNFSKRSDFASSFLMQLQRPNYLYNCPIIPTAFAPFFLTEFDHISVLFFAFLPHFADVCFEGYVMDRYCINRGTLLDNAQVKTLLNPEKHSLHCLVDVGVCRDIGLQHQSRRV